MKDTPVRAAWISSVPTFFAAILLASALFSANAAESDNDQESKTEELAKEPQNPVANLISVPFQNNFNFGIGPNDATQWVLNVQPVIPITLNKDWNLITRTITPIAGLYRQYELYYVIGDERDIVRLRTNFRLQAVYLYHLIPATPQRSRALFLDYVKTANELHDRAQWYNELFSNCTTNVRLHIKDIGSARPWDWQILINGFIAERAYELGAIDTSLPFAELRRLSYIDYRARDADDLPTFSSLIRKGLPGMP